MATAGFSGIVLRTDASGPARIWTGGFADHELNTTWWPRMRTQVGSISKQIVAVVALRLAVEGDVALDAPLSDTWSGTAADWRAVTLRQLLTHTAGVPHWHEAPGFRVEEAMRPPDRLRALLASDLATRPGTTWVYSSPGYLVATATIERMSGAGYRELVERLVLRPLHLADTRVGEPLGPEDAHGYDGTDPAPLWDLQEMPGTGDITSTAADIAVFLRALNSGELVGVGPGSDFAADVELPASELVTSGFVRRLRYAPGHFVGTVSGRPAILCPGDNPGFKALGVWLPDTATCVVALSNDEADDLVSMIETSRLLEQTP